MGLKGERGTGPSGDVICFSGSRLSSVSGDGFTGSGVSEMVGSAVAATAADNGPKVQTAAKKAHPSEIVLFTSCPLFK